MKLLLRRILFLLLPFIWIACENSSEEEAIAGIQIQDTLRYSVKKYNFPEVAPNTKIQLENWSVFEDFYTEASTLDGLTLENLRVKTEKLLRHTDSLSKKIPDTLYTNAIYSRLVIAKTRVELLKQEINRDIIDSERVEMNIDEANDAIKNLIIQLNEKFQKDGIDLQRIDNEKKELEKQKKFLDSVYQVELKGQQN